MKNSIFNQLLVTNFKCTTLLGVRDIFKGKFELGKLNVS